MVRLRDYLLLQAAFGSWGLAFALFLALPVALLGGVLTALLAGDSPTQEGLRGKSLDGLDDAGAMAATRSYSPYAGRAFPTRVYWGDTHVHTSLSHLWPTQAVAFNFWIKCF